jgi:hypothetical protein
MLVKQIIYANLMCYCVQVFYMQSVNIILCFCGSFLNISLYSTKIYSPTQRLVKNGVAGLSQNFADSVHGLVGCDSQLLCVVHGRRMEVEVEGSYEVFVCVCLTTFHLISEDCHFDCHHSENDKSSTNFTFSECIPYCCYDMLQFGKSWLERELQKYYQGSNPPGLSSDEFAETVVTMLNSGRSNDELQNEVR